jgi:hypothetical protein
MSKHEVTIEVTVTHTYEIDLEADAWASFDTVKQALEYDAGQAHEDPVLWMEHLGDLDMQEPHIKTRARVRGTNKYDVLLEDKEHNCAEAED